ncbi:MAG: serine/threonine protein kinase [Candidatus Sulfotelmatobacter sp.]
MSFAIGELVGDYEVIDRLGAGGMGEVYKVRHVISQRVEALKLLHDRDIVSPDSQERFSREIRVLARLQHPNIAVLHTAFRWRDRLAMVMEYVEGLTLGVKLHAPGLNLSQGIAYISQTLAALGFAHRHGVVHRDVKPSNMIIAHDDVLKLVDFGVAASGHDNKLTASGQIIGSFHYMSPEQINGAAVDARTDIYSVGVTLYEVVTGRYPIDGPNHYAIMTGHLNRVPVAPSEIKGDVPWPLSRIVMRALAKDPADRYQNADQMLADLSSVNTAFSAAMAEMVTVVAPVSSPSGGSQLPSGTKTPSDAHGGSKIAGRPEVVEQVGKELAFFIGPIATIIVKRAARDCTTVHELFAAVAPEIDSAADREKFLATRRRYAA